MSNKDSYINVNFNVQPYLKSCLIDNGLVCSSISETFIWSVSVLIVIPLYNVLS